MPASGTGMAQATVPCSFISPSLVGIVTRAILSGRKLFGVCTCAPDTDNFFFRSIFHPRDSGYEAKAAGLVAEAERLGVVPAR